MIRFYDVPIALDVTLDGRVLAFTAAVAALSCVLFGLVPALRASRADVGVVLGRNPQRYPLRCDAVASTGGAAVRASLESAFKEFGLPKAIRSDNGPPFATKGAGGLSRLSVWLIHLGITPERIEPGHPEQNGRHERMHRTLKEETALPPSHTLLAQQRAFDRFRHQYNEERPHEALGQKPPASVYEPSLRRMPPFLPELEYPPDVELRSVRTTGEIKWQNRHVYIGEALAHEIVSVQMIAYMTYVVCLGPIELGRIKDDAPHLGLIRPHRPRRR